MKLLSAIILTASLFIYGCSNYDSANDNNRGAQSGMDAPSNKDRDIPPPENDSFVVKEGNRGTEEDSLSEAPNNGNANPSEGISGQTGNNQTGQGPKK
jgi:hypothetical protein